MEAQEIIKKVDQDRKDGYRPSVMMLLTCNKKLLMFFAKEYQQWVFPQTGIENGETFEQSLIRLINDEVGTYIIDKFTEPLTLIGEKRSAFPNRVQGSKDMRTDDGQEVIMIGKMYYIFSGGISDTRVDISKSIFADAFFVNAKEAEFVFTNMPQVNKKEVFLYALKALIAKGFIA